MLSTPPSKKEAQHLIYNMFKNPGFETNLQGICKGLSDATATTTPIGIVGTTPIYPNGCLAPDQQGLVETLISRDTAAPLTGNASLKISKPASDRQNDIIYLEEMKVDESRKGKPLEFSFNYKYSEDFEITNGLSDIRVYVLEYDSNPASGQRVITLPISDVDGSGKFQASFTTTKNYVRPFLYVATTNANAYDFWVDDLLLTDLQAQFIPFMSDMEPVTVTGSWTTNTTYVAKRAVQGQFALYHVIVKTSGQPDNVPLYITIPDGIDTEALSISDLPNDVVALDSWGQVRDNGTNSYGVIATLEEVTKGTKRVDLRLIGAGGTYTNWGTAPNRTAPMTFANGDGVEIWFRVPIVGWTSGVKTQGQLLQNLPVLLLAGEGSGTSTVLTANTTNIPATASDDKTGSWNGSVFTVPQPGDYNILFSGIITAGSAPTIQAYKNGSANRSIVSITGTGPWYSGATTVTNLAVGDTISLRASQNATMTGRSISIQKINTPNTLLAINRSTTKYLASSLTSNTTDIASLRMTNLIVGKRYQVTLSVYKQTSSTASTVTLSAKHDGNTVAKNTTAQASAGSLVATADSTTISPPFIATTTTVTFDVNFTGTGTLGDDGTYVTLTELNNTVEGNF